jgi:hypothetical protein
VVGEVLGGTREEWTEEKGRNGREGLRRRRRTRKGGVNRVESRNMLMGERGEF